MDLQMPSEWQMLGVTSGYEGEEATEQGVHPSGEEGSEEEARMMSILITIRPVISFPLLLR